MSWPTAHGMVASVLGSYTALFAAGQFIDAFGEAAIVSFFGLPYFMGFFMAPVPLAMNAVQLAIGLLVVAAVWGTVRRPQSDGRQVVLRAMRMTFLAALAINALGVIMGILPTFQFKVWLALLPLSAWEQWLLLILLLPALAGRRHDPPGRAVLDLRIASAATATTTVVGLAGPGLLLLTRLLGPDEIVHPLDQSAEYITLRMAPAILGIAGLVALPLARSPTARAWAVGWLALCCLASVPAWFGVLAGATGTAAIVSSVASVVAWRSAVAEVRSMAA